MATDTERFRLLDLARQKRAQAREVRRFLASVTASAALILLSGFASELESSARSLEAQASIERLDEQDSKAKDTPSGVAAGS